MDDLEPPTLTPTPKTATSPTPATTASAARGPELLSPASATALELPILLALVAELTASDLGREAVLRLEPFLEEGDLEARRNRYQEVDRLLGDGPLVPAFDAPLGDLLERLETGRPPVGGADLMRLRALLRAGREAAERVRRSEPPCSALEEWVATVPDLEPLERRIGSVLDRRGEVRDDASPKLVELRGSIRKIRGRLYDRLSSYLTEHRETLAEDTIPMRGGRLVLTLPAGSRGRLEGLTHGRSGSGKTFYFEPLGVVDANNDLQQAVEDEEAERLRLLNELIAEAKGRLEELHLLAEAVAELDLLQAARRFAERCDGRLPERADRHHLQVLGARHPLLDPRLADLRERALGQPGHRGGVVPLDLELSPENRALVITGPNAGGKTVALKTVGLLTAAAQCGLPVPVAKGSRLPFLEKLVALVGDEQDLLADRSTFSGRLLRLKEAWEGSGPDSLLLLDELGSGTDPEEGSALSVALLEGLLEQESLGVITTHLTQLAAAALEMEGATCAAMEFDSETGEPTFRLLPGPPGGSEALALARRLGLPSKWLDRAEELLGSEHRELRKLLAEVERIRNELAQAKDRAEREASDVEKLRRRLAEEEKALAEERRTLGKKVRVEMDDFRRETQRKLHDEIEKLSREMEAGQRRKSLAAEAAERLFEEAPELEIPEAEDEAPLEEGGTVRHKLLGWEGRLDQLRGGKAEVRVKGKRVRCSADELTAVARPEERESEKRSGRATMSVDAGDRPVPRELKLLGERVEPALEKLDRYLDQALLSSVDQVRVVHGHGTGRLRQAVREHLKGHEAVESQRPGKPHEGGNGATVVEIRGS